MSNLLLETMLRLVVVTMALFLTSCDPDVQPLRITMQDFRFTPAEVRLTSSKMIRLTIVNEGRELHIFESPLWAHRVKAPREPESGIRITPNQRVDAMIQPVPGTYLFYCKIRGHTGMTGTLIVE
jgi:plastocyanin